MKRILHIIRKVLIYFLYTISMPLLLLSYFPVSKYPESEELRHIPDPETVDVEIFSSILVIIFSTVAFLLVQKSKKILFSISSYYYYV